MYRPTGISHSMPSRSQVLAWIHQLFNDVPLSLRVQELGKGVIYCRIINHYFPGTILINRIIAYPKSEYENTLNLRILQNALGYLKISLAFDPFKLSKEKLPDNWNFIAALYRYLNPQEQHTPNLQQGYFGQTVGPKRSIQQIHPQNFYNVMTRKPFMPVESNYSSQSIYNASKYSVGKLYRENSGMVSPSKGKWSVNSHMFQNNLVPIIDRIKQILLKPAHDVQKIRQVKILLNIPLNEPVIVKVEEDDEAPIIIVSNAVKPESVQTKEDIKSAD